MIVKNDAMKVNGATVVVNTADTAIDSILKPSGRRIGLVLTGGGARAAYQVGVLKAVTRIVAQTFGPCDLDRPRGLPFKIVSGTSAGALNAATLAGRADDVGSALETLTQVWENIHVEQVYRIDAPGLLRTGLPWLTMLIPGWGLTARWPQIQPRSLLDNQPLAELLQRMTELERVPEMLAQGHLEALAVTASSYTTGLHVTFYDSLRVIDPWERSQRIAMRTPLSHNHLLASAAIPFLFPAIKLSTSPDGSAAEQWFGDGSMRQVAPIAPAIHLGAERIMIIGSGRLEEPVEHQRPGSPNYPSVAQVAGHALSNIFLDSLAVDIERLKRINTTIGLIPPEARTGTPLRPIEALIIAPSERLDDIAADHLHSLPATIRALLRTVGVTRSKETTTGAALASYLLFESAYTRELIHMGENDAEARRPDIEAFFKGQEKGPGCLGSAGP
jgi:NTE family protein